MRFGFLFLLFGFYGWLHAEPLSQQLERESLESRLALNNWEVQGFQEGEVEVASVARNLALKCKSEWDGSGCDDQERDTLASYVVSFCGQIPIKAHQISKTYLKQYLSTPMLNAAFMYGFTSVNSFHVWPMCVVCSLDYPLDPGWEMNADYCQYYIGSS